MVADRDDKITPKFQEKPLCRSPIGFHGHLIFNWDILKYLEED